MFRNFIFSYKFSSFFTLLTLAIYSNIVILLYSHIFFNDLFVDYFRFSVHSTKSYIVSFVFSLYTLFLFPLITLCTKIYIISHYSNE